MTEHLLPILSEVLTAEMILHMLLTLRGMGLIGGKEFILRARIKARWRHVSDRFPHLTKRGLNGR